MLTHVNAYIKTGTNYKSLCIIMRNMYKCQLFNNDIDALFARIQYVQRNEKLDR